MTCTNNQVGILMQKIKKYNQIISAAKAGMYNGLKKLDKKMKECVSAIS
ncbi:hypothetical protein [Rickettsia endosymbiont of Urophora cardui]